MSSLWWVLIKSSIYLKNSILALLRGKIGLQKTGLNNWKITTIYSRLLCTRYYAMGSVNIPPFNLPRLTTLHRRYKYASFIAEQSESWTRWMICSRKYGQEGQSWVLDPGLFESNHCTILPWILTILFLGK